MVMSQQLMYRSKFLLCKLIGAIADESNPIVFILDDLQWSDETTLSVIQTIVTDPGEYHFLSCAACFDVTS